MWRRENVAKSTASPRTPKQWHIHDLHHPASRATRPSLSRHTVFEMPPEPPPHVGELYMFAILANALIIFVGQFASYLWWKSYLRSVPKCCPECSEALPAFHYPFKKTKTFGGVGVLCPNCNCEVGMDGRKVPPNTPAIKHAFPYGQVAMCACALISCLAFVRGVTQFAKIPIQTPVPESIRKLEPLVRPPRAAIDPATGWVIPAGTTVEEMKAKIDELRGNRNDSD